MQFEIKRTVVETYCVEASSKEEAVTKILDGPSSVEVIKEIVKRVKTDEHGRKIR